MAEDKIFRKVSLDRLSSPEELDQRLTVTSPIGWIALLAVGILIFAALMWGIFGRIADKTVGSGIIISSGGITSVIHHAAGQITDVSVHDGDYITKGQVIARIEQTELIREINANKEDLAAVKAIDLNKLELNNSQLSFNVYDRIGEIYKDYLIAKANLETKKSSEAETAFALQKQWLQKTIIVTIADLENTIARQQRDLLNNNEVIAGASGRVLEMQVKKGDILQAGSVVCTIAEEDAQTDSLEAVLYVPVDQGKRIMPGMEVNISPSTVKKEEHGFMLGNVISVSDYPASAQGMMLTLGNQDLVQQLSGNSAPIEVRIKLIMDSGTVSGYKWSTPQGPPIVIDDGTFCAGEVKVEQKRPISMVIPFIKKLLPV